MASDVDIVNIALAHLGARTQVSSINPPDGSVEAGYGARFYKLARTTMIEIAQPRFALRRTTLAQVANISTVWTYAYAKPNACLKPLRLLPLALGSGFAPALTEGGGTEFVIEGDVIRANEPDAVLVYLTDVDDASQFSPMFVDATAALLAAYMAGPIIKGEAGAKTGAAWRDVAYSLGAKAAASDGNGQQEPTEFTPQSVRVRA